MILHIYGERFLVVFMVLVTVKGWLKESVRPVRSSQTWLPLSQSSSSASPFLVQPFNDDDSDDDDHPILDTESSSPTERARAFLASFEHAWNHGTANDIVRRFFIECSDDNSGPFWRDMVAFTWNICTNEGKDAIAQALEQTHRPFTEWKLTTHPLPLQVQHQGGGRGMDFWCDLSIDTVGTAKAHIRLSSNNKIQTLLTSLVELHDRPFRVGHNRIRGHDYGPIKGRKYWSERLDEQRTKTEEYVVIIGGGQAGLALGARLHFLDIPYIILEAGSQPGVAWRNRYPSLHLHDPVWYNHMPYLPFPETWPVLCPREKVADWMEFYAKALDLNVEVNTRATQVTKGGDGKWLVNIETLSPNRQDDKPITKTLRTRHVVFATGNSSKARIPNIPGHFAGQQLHSSQYRGGRQFANKRVVVIGSNNSGFDIAQDLWEQGAKSVIMIQRSPSMVVSTESVLKHGLGSLYRQDAPLHHEDADLIATSTPYKLLMPRWKAVTQKMRETDKELHQGLINAGYQLDYGPEGMGIFSKSATEGGGFYIDMGCAELLIRGDVVIRYASVSRFEERSVVILDKKTNQEEYLDTDVVVYATGFGAMDQWLTELCGENISSSIGRTWGLGLGIRPHKDPGPWEGELRNMWKPTTVEGLWFHGGNLAQSRFYSRLLALQLCKSFLEDSKVGGNSTSVRNRGFGIPESTPTTKCRT